MSIAVRVVRDEDGEAAFVSTEAGLPVGDAWIRRLPSDERRHVAEIGVRVEPGARRRGHGALLAAAALDWARRARVVRVQGVVPTSDAGVIAWLRRAGFSEEARHEAFLRSGGALADASTMVAFPGEPDLRRVVAIGIREERGVRQLLCFEHPNTGWQVPSGPAGPGEAPEHALRRVVGDGSGLHELERVIPLGEWTRRPASGGLEGWAAWRVEPRRGLPDRWLHGVDEGAARLRCTYRWVVVRPGLVEVFPPVFHEALRRALTLA